MSSADNFSKLFGPRWTECRALSGSKLFDTLVVFLKEVFEKIDFEKNQQTAKSVKKYPIDKESITVHVFLICLEYQVENGCDVPVVMSKSMLYKLQSCSEFLQDPKMVHTTVKPV